METLTLKQAAAFLKLHPEEVRRRARLGLLPGAKPGKSWVFLEDDLVVWLRSHYKPPVTATLVTVKEASKWDSTNAGERGGSTLRSHPESELDALLRQASGLKRNISTTS